MLQPRLNCDKMKGCYSNFVQTVYSCVFIIFLFSTTFVKCQDVNLENEQIDATRIKREGVLDNRDLTVLLLNDQNRPNDNQRIGRYHSIKPLIGLLTSTARTFINDGVTTEFATQILGTTLNNGRIYAQLLTKSSLVLYNKPSNVDDSIKPTRVNHLDGQWSVKQDLGFIDPDQFILKNTDYLAPSKMDIVYASKPIENEIKYWSSPTAPDNINDNQILEEPTGRRVQGLNEIPRYEAFNLLDGPNIDTDRKIIVNPSIIENINTLHRHKVVHEPEPEIESRFKQEINETNVEKVKPDYNLPTFTIKNEFSPIFYYIDNIESRSSVQQAGQPTKLPKKMFGSKPEPRPKKTFTYVGFADFTTVVGDSVIIFTPNSDTVKKSKPGQVDVFPSANRNKLADKITFLASDIPVAASTFKAHEYVKPTKLTSPMPDEDRSEKALYNDEESLKKVLYDTDVTLPDAINVQYDNGFDFNLDVIQPSEAGITTTESTRLTDNLEVVPIQEYSSKPTEPLKIKPSASLKDNDKQSSLADEENSEILANSEEEEDNTAAEETDSNEEEDRFTTESNEALTTENQLSQETSDENENVTEANDIITSDSHEVPCTKGFETLSTMTTAYKTLTYLTTYFIPLDNDDTTTSIKSDVVVQSDIGYLTNVVCKTELNIEPTAILSFNVQSSIQSSLEQPSKQEDDDLLSESNKNEDDFTEKLPTTTQKPKEVTEKEVTTTSKENLTTLDEIDSNDDKNDEQDTTTVKTTTQSQGTTESRVEFSISTEHSSTTTEKISPEINNKDEDVEELNENNIEVIYKTLYTTYTYFTTFFGDSTSSIASHKSIVTNIITSSIDLSKLDPTLLGAFNEDEIAPSNVGIGRPTEAIHSIIDLVKNKDVIESVENDNVYSSATPTPALGEDFVSSIKPDAVKTYFTTYTFFTTIFVGDDANVCSRSEVYTNYVGPEELLPTKSDTAIEPTRAQFDFRNCKQSKMAKPANIEDHSSVETSVRLGESKNNENSKKRAQDSEEFKPTEVEKPREVDMLFSIETNPLSDAYVTDVKSSYSKGERKYLENNAVIDDQISSESNIEEIMPSPTLLLQTSYTTFTYFTTMYIGKDSSKVKSRLETITNVVTETIRPKKEPEAEENNLPITYYTTFTYWTTLYKDKSTTITSREEIVSNVVTPTAIVEPTVSPIDTSPIEIESALPPKQLEIEVKPSIVDDSLEHEDDGKATFYTTYTYFTTFYVGNTSQIRSSLETVTNVVDSTKVIDENRLGRKVQSGGDKNLIQDGEKNISPSIVKEDIVPTKLADISKASPTVLVGTYIDNLFAEVKPDSDSTPKPSTEKKILFSQVAVISGNSTIVTNDNKTLLSNTNKSPLIEDRFKSLNETSTEASIVSPTPEVIESSQTEPETEADKQEDEDDEDGNSRKKSRLTFTSKKPTFTPVIRPFASRNRPTFSPKRVPALSSATIITRSDFTPTITATPSLKSVRPSGGFGGNRKPAAFPASSVPGRRFSGRGSNNVVPSNAPSASRAGGFNRPSIQPTSRRGGFRSSSARNVIDPSKSALPRIRPTPLSRLRGRQSVSVAPPQEELNDSETFATQKEESITETTPEEVTEAPARSSVNPLQRFRRPILSRQPGTSVTPRSTTPTNKKANSPRGRVTTTTARTTARTTTNPLLSLRRQRPNALFPRRNLFKQPEPEPEVEIKENEQDVNEEGDEDLAGEDFDEDNDYESSDRKEQQVSTPTTPAPKRNSNSVQIRPFAFRRRNKRQVNYGSRKYTNFRRPTSRVSNIQRSEEEIETEPPTTVKSRTPNRYSSRLSAGRTTTSAPVARSTARQPFIIRGDNRATTTTHAPSFRTRNSRARNPTSARPRARPTSYNSQNSRSSGTRTPTRTRGRSTARANTRQRNSFENTSGERFTPNHVIDDGKITITYHIPTEVSIPVVNGKITEYKNVITSKPRIETLLRNQISTSLGPLGQHQLVLASEATEIAENGATKIIKFLLQETPTTSVVFTPTVIRGRKTSYSHIVPSTIYNVEPVTSSIAPDINANVPLANLLLSQLLLGNQQPGLNQINPLLALQGQGLIPQQPLVAPTPVTEYKTRTTTYVTTVTDLRETVLPITFRGTPILTTIRDPTVNVITATEFFTDTIVTQPTAVQQQQPAFNSLLLPFLLQQQQQQQAAALAINTPNPLFGLGQSDLSLVQNNLLGNDVYSHSPKPNILPDLISNEDYSDDNQDQESNDDISLIQDRRHNIKPAKASPPKITSVVTLYVSGRTPGEFSTILSTVISDDTQTVRKREATYFEEIKVLPSILPNIEILGSSNENVIENSIIADTEYFLKEQPTDSQIETQSLESIVGELNKYINYDASPTPTFKYVKITDTPAINKDHNEKDIDEIS